MIAIKNNPSVASRIGLLMLATFGLSAWAADGLATTTKPATPEEKAAALEKDVTQGALRVVDKDGQVVECPLKHTDVKADVAGFIARVKVTQTFHNPTKEKIEAVYVFPLPHEAAVDDMTMVIGQRKIVGIIKRRAEARAIYEAALLAGQTAALLEQERPNIFTQSVGNIEPGQDVNIEISYVDVLKYDMGTYEFHFPMVVGPRYNPGSPISSPPTVNPELQGKVAPREPDTTVVPDASRISPPVLKPGMRNGHDVSLSVNLNAGVPIQSLDVLNHKIDMQRDGRTASIKIAEADSIPNKDFVLRYNVIGEKPEMALLAHTGQYGGDWRAFGEGYFMLMIQPKEDKRLTQSPPREIVFLVDVSGSMSGQPTAKCIESMQHMLKLCREDKDTVQVITFASEAQKLFDKPVPVNKGNIAAALNFTQGLKGGGGTEMLKGVKLAIDEPIDKERIRIVIMLTDGYIGNEAQIIEHVGKNCGDQVRFWAVGIGQAPNMFLIDGVAKQGGGMGKKLSLNEDAQALCQEIMTRIQRAQLAKVKIDWGGLKVSETFPAKIPELWAGRPVIVYGRYADGGKEAKLTVSGVVEGQDVSWNLAVNLPAKALERDVLAKIWARQKIEDLMQQTYYQGSPEVEEIVTAIALQYSLMSQYTSFVAVDEKDKSRIEPQARPPRRMLVPVPIPEGTLHEGFFGGEREGGFDPAGGLVMLDAAKKADGGAGWHGNAPTPFGPGRFKSAPAMEARKMMASGRPMAAGPALPRQALGKSLGYAGGGGGGPTGVAAPAPAMKPAARIVSGFEVLDLDYRGEGYTIQAIGAKADAMMKAAAEALKAGQELLKQNNLRDARSALVRAYFLDTAAANVRRSNGQVAGEAMTALEKLHKDEMAAWAKEMPELNAKLDCILRDESIDGAIKAIAGRAKLSIELIPGSVEDAGAILGQPARINYLDLRHATVAQAMDWICQPMRMNWWKAKQGLVVGTDRRSGAESAWVYDVSAIALPDNDEFQKLGDYQKIMAAATKNAEDFLSVARAALKPADASSVAWFAPGQVLVVGGRDIHDSAAKLFADLADPQAKFDGAAADLQKVTAKRFADRKDKLAKADAARAKSRIAAAHDEFSWKLLAGAADGRLDDEAITELRIAWKAPQTADLLNGAGAGLAMRSLWAITESSRALTDDKELVELAASARQQAKAAARQALAALQKKADDSAAFTSLLYATLALANRSDAEFTQPAIAALTAAAAEKDPLASPRMVARVLLGAANESDRRALAGMLSAGVAGPDMVALTAIACRRGGEQSWSAFRAASKELLGEQALPGAVVVLVNSLANDQIKLASR
jgi:Ca-activated chloride channel family protein